MNLLLFSALSGGLTAAGLAGLLYLGERLVGWPFLPFDLFDWLARVLPGDIVTLSIDTIVSFIIALNLNLSTSEAAKLLEQLLALALFIVLGALAGLVIAAVGKRTGTTMAWVGAAVGAISFFGAAAVELSLEAPVGAVGLLWLAVALIFWGWLLGALIGGAKSAAGEETESSRRAFLLKLSGGALALAFGSWGLGRWVGEEPAETGAGESIADIPEEMVDIAAPPEALEARLEPAPGTRPEVTPEGDFYRIDINTRPVVIQRDNWLLEVDGLFAAPRNLMLQDIMAYPAVTQPITLSCISNRIGGDLIDTAYWTGVRLRDVLEDLQIQPEAQELFIEAADGFYESVSQEDMFDPRTLLVYGMNGETLPVEHGFPLRIYIPNRYGMKQPKWMTRMTAIAEEGDGYWVDRGWDPAARPHIVSIIDTIAVDEPTEQGLIPIGGIAWAGDRGIAAVEVQVDDGPWQPAELRDPPLSTLTWLIWRLNWPPVPGRHTFRVRAVDGEGMLQIAEETSVRPDGATGLHEVTETIG